MENKIKLNKIKPITFSKELVKILKNIKDEQKKDIRVNRMRNKISENITIKNDVIFVRQNQKERWQLAIPSQVAKIMIQETHTAMGHPGRYKTYHALKEVCTIKNMHRLITQIIRSCDLCQKNKLLNYSTKGKMTTYKPTKKLERVATNLMGPLPTGR